MNHHSRLLLPAAILAFTLLSHLSTSLADAPTNVPEAAAYSLVYDLDLPATGPDYRNNRIPYTVDNSDQNLGSISRIGYYLELNLRGAIQWVWVSIPAFSQDLELISIPATHVDDDALGPRRVQTFVSDMNVLSNLPTVTSGNGIPTGNIEFWSGNYATGNTRGVPGASSSSYDFGDQLENVPVLGGYGCMQIHNFGAGETLFALNRFHSTGDYDLGIGNNPVPAANTNNPQASTVHGDWTFQSNADTYQGRRLQIFVLPGPAPSSTLLSKPAPNAIVQRNDFNLGTVEIEGIYSGPGTPTAVEARLVPRPGFGGVTTNWRTIDTTVGVLGDYSGEITGAGGWYDLEIRVLDGASELTSFTQEKVGIGEIFITAGQSNSANSGEVAQTPGDERVSAYDYRDGSWRFASDPQPIATGSRGSPWPDLGTILAADLDVPVGFLSVGWGGTSVLQWLPGYDESHPDFSLADLDLYERLQRAVIELGSTTGFRSVLWHQGESDNAPGRDEAYQERLEQVIARSRVDGNRNFPWGVAIVSGDGNVQNATLEAEQRAVIAGDPSTFEGANTDTLRKVTAGDPLGGIDPATGMPYRENNGQGIHFSDIGLLRHAELWLAQIQASDVIPAVPPLISVPDLTDSSDSGASAIDNVTNVDMPTFGGFADAFANVELHSDVAGLIGSTSADAAGAWTITSTVDLDDGVHAITATSSAQTSAPLSVTIDTVAPPSGQPDLTDATDTGASNSDNITNDATPDFEGVSEEGVSLALASDADGLLIDFPVGNGGNWSVSGISLSEGTHSLTAEATDLAGNVSTSAALSVTIDVTAPAAPTGLDLTDGSDSGASDSDDVTNDDTPEVTGDAPAGSLVTLLADGVSVGTGMASSPWTIVASSIGDGIVGLTATAEDTAGNVSPASAALSVTIDTVPPSVTVEKAAGQPDRATGTPIDFTATFSEDVSGFDAGDVSLSGSANPSGLTVGGGPAAFSVSVGAVGAEGTVTASVVANAAEDLAGNLSTASNSVDNTVQFTFDRIRLPADIPGEVSGVDADFGLERTGRYFGLIRFDDPGDPDIDLAGFGSGRLSENRRDGGGVFSARIEYLDHSYRLRGPVGLDGTFTQDLTVLEEGAEVSATVELDLSDTPGGKRIVGTLTTVNGTARIDLFQRVFHPGRNPAPEAGSYTFLLPGDPAADPADQPGGDGAAFANLNTSGVARLKLFLGDGTRSSVAAFLNPDSELQFYRALYTRINRGFIGGVITFRDIPNVSCADGVLHWKKPEPVFTRPGQQESFERRHPVYVAGFDLQQPIIASPYVPPVAAHQEPILSQLVPGEDNATFFTGASDVSVIGPRLVSWIRTVFFRDVEAPGTITFRFGAGNGFARGSFRDATGRLQRFFGVAFQRQGVVSGNFVGLAQTGFFHIESIEQPLLEVTRVPGGTPLSHNDTVDFGDTGFEGGFTDVGLDLGNAGLGALEFFEPPALAGSDAFSLVASREGTVAPGGSTGLRVRFQPTSAGAQNATLTLISNDEFASPFVLNLTGNGVAGNSGGGRIQNGPAHTGTPPDPQNHPGANGENFDSGLHSGRYEGLIEDVLGYVRIRVGSGGGATLVFVGRDGKAVLRGLIEADGVLVTDNGRFRVDSRVHHTGGGQPQIRGTLTDLGDGESFGFVATKNAFSKATPSPDAGRYTLLLPANDELGEDFPGGDGAGVMTVDAAGVARLVFLLADGTTATVSATQSGDRQINVFRFLNRARAGFIGGLISFRDVGGVSDCDGVLAWNRERHPRRRQFSAGFSLEQPLVGARYLSPAKGTRALANGFGGETDNADVIFEGAGLVETVLATWDTANRITTSDARTRLRLNARNGLLTGVRTDEAGRVRIRGVVFQKQGLVGGHFFFRDNQTGLIQVLPR